MGRGSTTMDHFEKMDYLPKAHITVAEARRIEQRLCSCGVVQMFGGESWAVQHAAKCPAEGVIREAVRDALRAGAW